MVYILFNKSSVFTGDFYFVFTNSSVVNIVA